MTTQFIAWKRTLFSADAGGNLQAGRLQISSHELTRLIPRRTKMARNIAVSILPRLRCFNRCERIISRRKSSKVGMRDVDIF